MKFQIPESVCTKCGHKWNPRVPEPLKCPKCFSFSWQEEKEEVKSD